MADDKKRQQNKQVSDAKKNVEANKGVLKKQKVELERQSNLQEIQNKIQKTSLTAQKLRDAGDANNAKILQQSLEDVQNLLSKNQNATAVANRLDELIAIEENAQKIKEVEKAKKDAADAEKADKQKANDKRQEGKEEESLGTSLNDLTNKLKGDTEILAAQQDLGSRELGKKIGDLSLGAQTTDEKERAETLRKAFKDAQSNLDVAIESGDPEAIRLAKQQVENLKKTVKSEEDNREQRKKTDEANSTLLAIRDQTQGFNDKLKSMAKGGGFVAGLAAVVLAVFSPETLGAVVMKVVDWFTTIVDALEALITGDMETFKTTLKDNFALFAGLLGLGLFYFGPALLSGLFTVMRSMKLFRGFMLVTAFPTIGLFFTSMYTSVLALLAPMLAFIVANPVTAIILGIIAVGAFFTYLASRMTGFSMLDTIKIGFAHLKDGLARMGNFFVSLAEGFLNMLGKLKPLLDFLGIDSPDFANMKLKRMSTDNASKAVAVAEANKAEAEAKKAEAALEKERQSKLGTGEGFDMSQLGAENADIMADLQAQGFNIPSTLQTNVSNNSSSSQSTTIVTERPSRSSTILNSYNSAVFR